MLNLLPIAFRHGDPKSAFWRLKQALSGLGVEVFDWTFEECDDEFQRILYVYQRVKGTLISQIITRVSDAILALDPAMHFRDTRKPY